MWLGVNEGGGVAGCCVVGVRRFGIIKRDQEFASNTEVLDASKLKWGNGSA